MRIFILLFLSVNLLCSLKINAQVIPVNRTVDWTVAGLQKPIPDYANVVDITTFGGNSTGTVANDMALKAAVQSLGNDSGVIFFPAGNYLFQNAIVLRSGLVLRGMDASKTTLSFNLNGINDLITVMGNITSIRSNVTATATKNQNFIRVSNPSFFAANDFIKLYQNDSALVLDVFRSVGQILRIRSVKGDTLMLTHPLRRSYNLADSPKVQKLLLTTGVGVECLKIKRLDSTVTQQTNVNYNYAYNCWLKGVESDSTNFAHVAINNCTNIQITGSYFHGSYNYGPGGRGYGVAVQTTSGECLVENNIFQHLRHSMLLQSGANGNVFVYNYSREPYKSESTPYDLAGDIVLHGNYPYANLFEGNIIQTMVQDASHKINGPFNTFYRNRVELYGVLVSDNSGDSLNVVGNEVTNTTPGKGYYIIKGNGNFEYGNNIKGTTLPLGTNSVNDSSYYYKNKPAYWDASNWFSIGLPSMINVGTIPTKKRFDSGLNRTVCNVAFILAAEKLTLTAKSNEAENLLRWDFVNNKELQAFEVERSGDGIVYSKIKTISGQIYQYLDNSFYAEKNNYYRIKAIFKNGTYSYSSVASVRNSNHQNFLTVYPNPAKDFITILNKNQNHSFSINIKNSLGQSLKYYNRVFETTFSIDIKLFSEGLYFIEAVDNATGERTVRKFMKE